MSKSVEWGDRYGEGSVICQCDYCSEAEEFDFYKDLDFRKIQGELKDLGWISRKIDGEWYDFCTEQCFYDWIKENK